MIAKPDQRGASLAPLETGAGSPSPLTPENVSLLRRLFDEHADNLRRYVAARFGPGPPEPEEVAQAAFAKFAAGRDIGAIGNPRGFLYTIACNIVFDHRRRAMTRESAHRELMIHHDANSMFDLHPERVLLAKEQFAVFETALKRMPATRRRIFLMVRAEGRAPAAVAIQFGMTEGAVHKHVSRALADCAAAFAKFDQRSGGRP